MNLTEEETKLRDLLYDKLQESVRMLRSDKFSCGRVYVSDHRVLRLEPGHSERLNALRRAYPRINIKDDTSERYVDITAYAYYWVRLNENQLVTFHEIVDYYKKNPESKDKIVCEDTDVIKAVRDVYPEMNIGMPKVPWSVETIE